jgi:hypothetical protein
MEPAIPAAGRLRCRGHGAHRRGPLRDMPIEQLITVPLEQDLLNGVAWLKVIRSDSIPGLP